MLPCLFRELFIELMNRTSSMKEHNRFKTEIDEHSDEKFSKFDYQLSVIVLNLLPIIVLSV